MAGVYEEENKLDLAESMYLRSLTIIKKNLGVQSGAYKSVLDNVAGFLTSHGKEKQANALIDEAKKAGASGP